MVFPVFSISMILYKNTEYGLISWIVYADIHKDEINRNGTGSINFPHFNGDLHYRIEILPNIALMNAIINTVCKHQYTTHRGV